MLAVGRHNSTLKPSLSDAFHKRIYCVIWLTLYALESVGCYSGKEGGYLYGPNGVLSFRQRSFATTEVKETHAYYTVCSLQGNTVYCLALATQVPSLPLSVGYQNKNACICLGQRYKNLTFLLFSPCGPAANYILGCRKTLGWLAGAAALGSVICAVLSLLL